MADRIMDAEDRRLEALFRSPPVPDDGFSHRVVRKIRRRLWLRRLAVPVAAMLGGAIAAKPAADLAGVVVQLIRLVPEDIASAPLAILPEFSMLVLGAMMLAVLVLLLRFIEET